MSSLPRGLRNNYNQIKKTPIGLNSKFRRKIKRVNSVNALREKKWNDRFIYDKIPVYDSFNDKNVLLNMKKKCNSSRKKFGNIMSGIPMSFIDNSLYLYRPLSNKTTIFHPLINGKNSLKTTSARIRGINFPSYRNMNLNRRNLLLYESKNKFFENYKKDEFLNRTNNNENNFSNINLINLKNIIKQWDEMFVSQTYRQLFYVIYKELDDDDKEELYQRETNEIISIKNDINSLKNNIKLRLNTIKEISELNKKLNTEIINKDNRSNEIIINEISDKIGVLREHTVNVCKSMKKLKLELNGLKYLDKYDINKIAQKFQFDSNYLIKMKGELNFLKEGFAKYYFNIKNDQTPFLIKASEKSKIDNDKDPFIHLVPIDKDLKNDILECSYYIYQELIAYQNEKVSKKILRCISPLKRIDFNKNEDNTKFINGKEEKENENIISSDNNNINSMEINDIRKNSNRNKDLNLFVKKESYSIDNNIKTKEDINENENKDQNIIQNVTKENENIDIINDNNKRKKVLINKRNDKRFKTGVTGSVKNRKNEYKNILLNYKINEQNINKRKSSVNRKKNSLHIIDKFLIRNKNSDLFSENNKNDDGDKKESNKISDKFLSDNYQNKNKIQGNE